MIEFKVTVLGSGSAIPTSEQNPSSQLVTCNNIRFLIDCGEGTQMQMIKHHVRHSRLDHIFISHLHGDHYYGLIGLLNSYHLMHREKSMHVFAPRDLESMINLQLRISNTTLVYPLHFHYLETHDDKPLFESEQLIISSFPLKHSIPVWGFRFQEKEGERRVDKSFIQNHNPDIDQIVKIKNGADFTNPEGEVLKNETITNPPNPARSFAYCSDTAYLESTGEYVKGVDLLYHESTFDNSMKALADKTLHSTASQAAQVAKEAEAGKLLLGHYSARFKRDLIRLQDEAREVFPNSFLSREGETYHI